MRVIGYLNKWEGGEKPADLKVDFLNEGQKAPVCSFIVTIDEPGKFTGADAMLRYEAAEHLLDDVIPQMQEALEAILNTPPDEEGESAEEERSDSRNA